MTPARWGLLAAVVVVFAVVARVVTLGGSDTSLQALLAGEPRRPDVAGVVASVDEDEVTLRSGQSLAVHPDVVVVSSYTREPVAPRPDLFVHIGLADGQVRWMAVLGVVVRVDPPYVPYTATIVDITVGELILADGTVLPVADGIDVAPGFAIIAIDPTTGVVTGVDPGS